MAMWSFWQKGCGKGFGKGKAKANGASQGHTKPRTRLSAEKFTGQVAAWKGKYGWITPAEEIAHEKASLNNGGLFVSNTDIEGADLAPGSSVEFHIYEDESGLGAEEIVVTGPPQPGFKPPTLGKGKSPSAGKGAAKGFGKAWGGGGWGMANAKGWGMVQPTIMKAPWMMGGKMGMMMMAKGKGKGKGKSAEGGKGHLLPRTRVSADKFSGTVAAWKGKYGWITPDEPIDHPAAKKHNGGIFVGKDDVAGGVLTTGAKVEFHIWEDSSGLGAEEVVQN